MTALTIIQTAAAWLSLPVPTGDVFASTDPQTIQLRSLLNEDLDDLRTWGDSLQRKLMRQHTFTTLAADVQPANALPDDLEYIITDTMWDRTVTRPVVGPITPQTWQAWKARPVLTSILYGYRLRGNEFLTAPNPPAGDSVYYEYISNLAVYSDGATTPDQTQFEANTDTSIYPDVLLARGIRWRFLKAKQFAWEDDHAQWSAMMQRYMARNKAMPTINTAGGYWSETLAGPYVQSQNFPGPTL